MKTIEIQVRVVPRASRNELVQNADGIYTARVTAPPLEGEANRAVIRLLAEHFDTAPSRIQLLSGQTARTKRFRINESPKSKNAKRQASNEKTTDG